MNTGHIISARSFLSLLRLYVGVLLVAGVFLPPVVSDAAEGVEFRTKFDHEIVPGQPALVCTRVERGPLIDGDVDKDPVWQSSARSHGAWSQIARHQASGRQTVVYSCYDEKNLYFAFVCEEPELHIVRMDGKLDVDDCVEAILEVGGLQGNGNVYSFRANLRGQAASWGLTPIPTGNEARGVNMPAWQSAGKFGPNRWMMEMAIPFASLKKRVEQKGMDTPTRGDLLGLKLVRWGAQQEDPKNRMVSVWNTDIAFSFAYVAGMNGLLHFQDSNALTDGDFAVPAAESPWQRKDSERSQSVAVRGSSFYRLSVASDQPDQPMAVLVDGKKLDLKNGKAGFWTGAEQANAVVTLRPSAGVAIRQVTMEYQPGEEPPGTYCLTGNYRNPDRNIRAAMPAAPDGHYRYVYVDFLGQVTDDANPAIPVKNNQVMRVEGGPAHFNTRIEDLGGTEGWVPFSKGSLTGKPESILWAYVMLEAPQYTYAIRGHQMLELDLGQEYFVRGLDVLWPAPYTENFEVWGKVSAEDDWTLLSMDDGPFVEPSARNKSRRAYESVRGLDSTVRYLRWRNHQIRPVTKCMDGIQEVWVWGEPKGNRTGIKPFQAWIPNENAPSAKWVTSTPDPDACQIIPRPRKMETANGWFIISPRTRIVAQADPESRKDAKQIQDEIRARWQITVPVVEESPAVSLDNIIYLGQPTLGAVAEALRKEEDLELGANPQRYALRASTRRVVILGNDNDGLYWGVQSLMLAMRWHNSMDPQQNGLGIRCMKVEDWPVTLERAQLNWKPLLFNCVPSQTPRLADACHLWTRFKWNVDYGDYSAGKARNWPPGMVTAMFRQVRDQYHMEFRPMLLVHPLLGVRGWDSFVKAAGDYSIVENNPDEAQEELGQALNLCPMNPKTYELIFSKIDDFQEKYDWPQKIWLGGLVIFDTARGSRWGVCRNCQISGQRKEELFSLFAEKIAQHLRERKMRGVLEPWDVAFGDKDEPKWKRALLATDVTSLPRDFEFILPQRGQINGRGGGEGGATGIQIGSDVADRFIADMSSDGLSYVRSHLKPEWTANGPTGWPSVERVEVGGIGNDLGTATALSAKLVPVMEELWTGSRRPQNQGIDVHDLLAWGNCWHAHRDFPSWRAGDRPTFFPIDLRPFVNHSGCPAGNEALEAGRVPPIDLRYLPVGKQVLSGVEFDLIDPARNEGKSLLMLGRPIASMTHVKDAAGVTETTGPISVGRKLASLAFLRAGWSASTQGLHFSQCWLLPTCRVIYDDDQWLPVDCFRTIDSEDYWNTRSSYPGTASHGAPLLERLGWEGNCPQGSKVTLKVSEWVNPYPEKTVKSLQFFTPTFEMGNDAKMPNQQCQAFVAITGVEPIAQDFHCWSNRADRPPLLPAIKPPAIPGVALRRVKGQIGADGQYAADLKGPSGETKSRVEWTADAQWNAGEGIPFSSNDCGCVGCSAEFKPFGAVQTLEPPVKLCRVDLRGPVTGVAGSDTSYNWGHNYRVDVTVEISEDGQRWRPAGTIRGIPGDADFIPLEFDPVMVKKIRFSATGEPYHENYSLIVDNPHSHLDCPHFTWRLIAPTDTGKEQR